MLKGISIQRFIGEVLGVDQGGICDTRQEIF